MNHVPVTREFDIADFGWVGAVPDFVQFNKSYGSFEVLIAKLVLYSAISEKFVVRSVRKVSAATNNKNADSKDNCKDTERVFFAFLSHGFHI